MRWKPLMVVGVVFGLCTITGASPAPRAFDAFAGKWAGHLEYRDFQNPTRRAKIPVTLEVTSLNATGATWNFKYDDFGKAVMSFETHTWKDGVYSVATKGEPRTQRLKSTTFTALSVAGSGKATLTGSQIEVGREVQVRRTITLGAQSLTTLTETHPQGEAFQFRNQSTYRRAP